MTAVRKATAPRRRRATRAMSARRMLELLRVLLVRGAMALLVPPRWRRA
ncbi:MAG: hypothetical protein H0W96_16575, partial [Solirubrobacterales bacterium]|nr:hypothetical protein [Solirubrobacterales bacterium]